MIRIVGDYICKLFSVAASAPLAALAETALPLPVSVYDDSHLTSLIEVLRHRVQVEPLNLFATAIFFLAIMHTFLAPMLLRMARTIEESRHLRWLENRDPASHKEEPASFMAVSLHYLGEIEAVFGIWAIPLMLTVAAMKSPAEATYFLEKTVHFNEAVFVVVVMAIASTQPVLYLAERVLSLVAAALGGSPAAWWFTLVSIGPVLGSLITEPAAMTICAILLAQHFFRYRPSAKLSYATCALLFSNVSMGGVLTHFAAPPVIMVSSVWGWDTRFMFLTFGWRALCAVIVSAFLYFIMFRKEFRLLAQQSEAIDQRVGHTHERPVSPFVILGNMAFLAWTVAHAESSRLVIMGFLFFLAFVDATRHFQRSVSLRAPLLVGFFLAGLVIHGEFQAWWIEPLLTRLDQVTLFVSSIALSAFNDNASITYLASLVPHFSDELKYMVVAGALAGGGLTIIANAPNPAGNALLSRFFDGGVSPVKLLVAAVVPLVVNILFFVGMR
ncbi:MAG: hypothetical protein RL326_281 [Pseudomonadota bacterium]